MKVVVVVNFAPLLVSFRGPMLAAMVARGHEVIAMSPDISADVRAFMANIGVQVEEVALDRTGLNPAGDLRTTASLVRRLRRLSPDLIFTFTHKPNIYAGLAAQIAGVPRRFAMVTGLGYSFLGQDSKRRRALGSLVRGLLRMGLAGSHGVFFQNPDDLALFEHAGVLPKKARRIMVNGSGVDVDHYALAPPPPPPIVFLFLGRLLREKGIVEFVQAARIVKKRSPYVRFRVVGRVDPNPASVSAEEVAGWVREGLLDYTPEAADVRPILASAHCLVLPSYREGTPRSVLEAMSVGRAVITTDAPGCRETVTHGDNGLLVPVKDAPALAAAMLALVDDPAGVLRMGARGRRIAEEKYDVRKVNAVMLDALGL